MGAVQSYWWGDQVAVTHEQLETWLKVSDVGSAIGGGLSALGVSAPVAIAIGAACAGVSATLRLIDKGNGIYLNILKVKFLSAPIRFILETSPAIGPLANLIKLQTGIDVIENMVWFIGENNIIVFPSRK